MPKRKVLVLDEKGSPWEEFLTEFFEDVPAGLNFFHQPAAAGECLLKELPDIALVRPACLSLTLRQKIKVIRRSRPEFRLFAVSCSEGARPRDLTLDDCFTDPPAMMEFQKRFVRPLPFAECVDVLIIDDEEETASAVTDFLKDRANPSFEVRCAENGKKGLACLKEKLPDVILLDIKMPVMDGREFYKEIRRRQLRVPVIVFFDAVSAEEVTEIRDIGKPAVVEKGSRQSAMPEMADLIKKMVYFG